ncbi:MAG: hypothetical protein LBG60_15025 [Bifidobacteriaceae bacterium]|jgi:hypothetical protein|nr:hypothetical protein [Bifidobacteriaceae bacterium]
MATGISRFTAQATARAALVKACKAALAGEDVDVGAGFRWPIVSNDWCFAVDTDSDIDPATVGPRRALDETVTLSLSVGAWRPGGDEDAEVEAFERAFDILARVQDHIRTQDITLGGTVLWCLPGKSQSAGATTSEDAGMGRVTEIAADFVCRHRITTV